MRTSRPEIFVIFQVGLMTGLAFVLNSINFLRLDVFYALTLIGFLVLSELTSPFAVAPLWRRRVHLIAIAGSLGFGVLLLRIVLAIV